MTVSIFYAGYANDEYLDTVIKTKTKLVSLLN